MTGDMGKFLIAITERDFGCLVYCTGVRRLKISAQTISMEVF